MFVFFFCWQAGFFRHTEDAQGHDVILFQGPWKPKGNRWWLEVWNQGQWCWTTRFSRRLTRLWVCRCMVWYIRMQCIYIYIYLLYDVHWRSVYRYITQCVYNCDVAYFFLGQMHMCMATYVFLQCAPLLQWLRGMPKQVKVCVLDGPPSRPPRTRITSRKKLRKNCAGSDGVCG